MEIQELCQSQKQKGKEETTPPETDDGILFGGLSGKRHFWTLHCCGRHVSAGFAPGPFATVESPVQMAALCFPRISSPFYFFAFLGFPVFSTTGQKGVFFAGVLIPAKFARGSSKERSTRISFPRQTFVGNCVRRPSWPESQGTSPDISFGACCLDVRTLTVCQLTSFPN